MFETKVVNFCTRSTSVRYKFVPQRGGRENTFRKELNHGTCDELTIIKVIYLPPIVSVVFV